MHHGRHYVLDQKNSHAAPVDLLDEAHHLSQFGRIETVHDFIQKNRADAINIYIDEEKSKLAPAFIAKMLASPDLKHTIVPLNTMKYAAFMHKTGSLKNLPGSWKDYYFPEVHDVQGS